MGIVQAEEPVCGKEGMFAAFDPLFEGRQHPRCPNPRFDPRPFLVRQRRLMGLSGSGSPRGHWQPGLLRRLWSSRLHLPAPLGSPGITRLHRYYGCCNSCPPNWLADEQSLPRRRPGSPCFTQPTFRALRLQPPTRSDGRFSTPAFAGAGSNPSAPSASPPQGRVWASPLCRRLARRYGRIEFLIVRMALSPPVALHPASRRRSYSRLQAGVGIPGEDLHLPDQLRLQAHGTGLRRCGLQNKQRLTPTEPSNGRSRVKRTFYGGILIPRRKNGFATAINVCSIVYTKKLLSRSAAKDCTTH